MSLAGAEKFVRDLLCDVTNMSDPQSSNMRHMVNDVSAPSGVISNDLIVILDTVFCFGLPYILIYHNYEFCRKHAYFISIITF